MRYLVNYKCRECGTNFSHGTIQTLVPLEVLQHSLDRYALAKDKVSLSVPHQCKQFDFDSRIGVADLTGLTHVPHRAGPQLVGKKEEEEEG